MNQPQDLGPPYSIFIAHPSSFLTDNAAHGDGLAAFEFIKRLAARGHTLHVATERVDIRHTLPGNVVLYPVAARRSASVLDRVRLMKSIDGAFNEAKVASGVDLVHQLNPVDLGLTGLLRLEGRPLVLGPYVPAWPAERSGAKRVARRSAETVGRWWEQRRAAALLLSTPAAQSRTAFLGPLRPTIHYLGAGVDQAAFLGATGGKAPNNRRILSISGLELRKGLLSLIRAFTRVADLVTDAELVIGGDGSARALIESAVMESPARERIHLIGRVEREDVPSLVKGATVFCMPSRGEPFGLAALEAMAAGIPVVGTDAGGLRFLLDHQPDMLVPVDDWQQLANRLVWLLNEPEVANLAGLENQRIVREQHDWGAVITRLEDVYRGVVLSRG